MISLLTFKTRPQEQYYCLVPHLTAPLFNGKEGFYRRIGENLCSGELSRFSPNSQGTQQRADESTYDGEWRGGQKHGQGTLRRADGSYYTGEWQYDQKHGRGTLQRADGSYYTGEWRKDKRDGEGEQKWGDGTIYKGEWKDNQQHGTGTEQYSEKDWYLGVWTHGWPGRNKENPFFFTFDLKRDREMLNHFPTPEKMSKRAAIFQSTEDHNGAFHQSKQKCQLLADAFSKGGYVTSIGFFSSSEELTRLIEDLPEGTSFIWLRAHGLGETFRCGPFLDSFSSAYGDIHTLSLFSKKLSRKPTIVLESCNLGKEGMLAAVPAGDFSRVSKVFLS